MPGTERGLFRWVGGKGDLVDRIAPIIRAHIAATGGKLVSCFYGSGAIEREVGGEQIGAEGAPELLALFDDLKRFGGEAVHARLIEFARACTYSREGYLLVRDSPTNEPLLRSARFLWLSAMAFNGIWRVNSRGRMNTAPDPSRLADGLDALPPLSAAVKFAAQIRRTIFIKGFHVAFANARPADVVFADPPYMGAKGFRSYTKEGFDDHAQRFLAARLREHVDAGGAAVAFNSPIAARFYERWARLEESMRTNSVSCDPDDRKPVADLLITAGLAAQERAA